MTRGVEQLSRDPRIVYLQPCARLGGAERHAATAIAGLARSELEVVPVVGPSTLLCRWLEPGGVRGTILSRAFPPAWPTGSRARLESLRPFLRALRRLADQVESILRHGGIDAVIAGAPVAWVAASRAGRRLGIPVVWRHDGSSPGPCASAALRLCSALTPPDLVLHDSEAARATCAVALATPNLVLPAGVDLDLFAPGRDRGLRPAGATLVVGFAGRLAAPARPEEFVRLAARLAPGRPGVIFVMAGEGPRRARCEALARDLGVERSLRLLGPVGDMPTFYTSCDIVVHPSYEPGCGTTLLEAMATGRAVVAADGPATRERLVPGREGMLTPPHDREALAQTVATLLDLPGLRDSLGRGARLRARRDFDARRLTSRLGGILAQLAESRRKTMAALEVFASDPRLLRSSR
jgi:glycosyltransferase involved in cell wall biosynthesis